MVQHIELFPGITLHTVRQTKFKHSCLSLQILRPMADREVSVNALIPTILLRGTQEHPDLRSITQKLDDLYGASIGVLLRRLGDYQATGLFCSFIEDRFAMEGDQVLQPLADFLQELLCRPLLENGGFSRAFTESEKRNLILSIESDRNDKSYYASAQLFSNMCAGDSYGIHRLGTVEQVAQITPTDAYAHYQKILQESPICLFYVGSAAPETVAALLRPIFSRIPRQYQPLPPQTAFTGENRVHLQEEMEVTQAKLCMGFVTPITNRHPEYAAMQLLNSIFGGGMTSKLFLQVREASSLCYSIHSRYLPVKGILTVSAGIDTEKESLTREKILQQLELCQNGGITQEELRNAKEALLSGLRGIHDSPSSIEGYYGTRELNGNIFTLESYRSATENVTLAQLADAAKSLSYHSSFVLKGVAK